MDAAMATLGIASKHRQQRGFVLVAGRRVHYRIAGRGPVVLLLHQSPRSSLEYLPLIDLLADRYTVIAPDNPGNGLSQPLPEDSRAIEDYGDAVAAFLTAIGIKRVLLYGFHTGAAIGLAFAARHPDRIATAVLNGIPVPNPATVEPFVAGYLPPFAPRTDGSHLCWLWYRLREQSIFYPWFSTRDEDRLASTPPDGDALFNDCMDVLRPGDTYRHTYAAAFRVPTQSLVARLRAAVTIVSARWDPLFAEMEALEVPDGVERVRLGLDRSEYRAVIDAAFARHAAAADAEFLAPVSGDAGFAAGLHYRLDAGPGRPRLLLHDHHDDGAGAEIAAAAAASDRPAIVVDLPGHGESDAPWVDLADATARIAGLVRDLGSADADVTGFGLGARVAAGLTPGRDIGARTTILSAAQHARGSVLIDDYLASREQPGRLLGAWQMARDGALFDPWCDPVPANARRPASDLDPAAIQRRALAALKSMRSWRASWAAMV